MIEILVASHNRHKVNELKTIMDHPEIRLISLSDIAEHDDVIEDGSSFLDNAAIKAKYFANKHHMITISDDSGLVVEALDGRPGIYSARYSGGTDHDNNLKILKEMDDIENRSAYFISVIVLCYPNGVTKSYEGRAYGYIGREEKGHNGFGYDSIFYAPEYQKTFAELDSSLKNRISHRANALSKLKGDLHEIIDYK